LRQKVHRRAAHSCYRFASFRCYNASQHMADWKQITARIRRARSGKDPVAQLSSLFERTRDAMVAFELARVLETSGQNSEAAKWYIAAAERFRRADWKTKAQEAAVRLGADMSAASAGSPTIASPEAKIPDSGSSPSVEGAHVSDDAEKPAEAAESQTDGLSGLDSARVSEDEPKRRHRGRRGGRNRRRGEGRKSALAPSPSSPPASSSPAVEAKPDRTSMESVEPEAPRKTPRRFGSSFPAESVAEAAATASSTRGRSGDPGLSSRLSALEMQLRRLLSCPPAKLSDSDHAPAGPGVLVLTDSDLTSYYYVEACPTLRVAVGNLLRGGASRRGVDSIKPRLAEHLGIPETRVAKYLADHCVVRWLQLDDGASHFAHFVVAVLRPTLNE
jgi:hypothetical protein